MKTQIISALIFFLCGHSEAQLIFSERTLTKPAYIIQNDSIQSEFGTSYVTVHDDGEIMHDLSIPAAFIRFGINDHLELRTFLSSCIHLTDRRFDDAFFSDYYFQAGAKIKFWEQKGVLPYTSMIVNFVLPDHLFNTDPQSEALSDYILMAFENKIGEGFFINYNIGLWLDSYLYYIYALQLSELLFKRFLMYAEMELVTFEIQEQEYQTTHPVYNIGTKMQLHKNIQFELSLLFSNVYFDHSTYSGLEADWYPFNSINAGVTFNTSLKKHQ